MLTDDGGDDALADRLKGRALLFVAYALVVRASLRPHPHAHAHVHMHVHVHMCVPG